MLAIPGILAIQETSLILDTMSPFLQGPGSPPLTCPQQVQQQHHDFL